MTKTEFFCTLGCFCKPYRSSEAETVRNHNFIHFPHSILDTTHTHTHTHTHTQVLTSHSEKEEETASAELVFNQPFQNSHT